MLKRSHVPQSVLQFGWTPLKKAALGGNTMVLEMLLQAGAHANNPAADSVCTALSCGLCIFENIARHLL